MKRLFLSVYWLATSSLFAQNADIDILRQVNQGKSETADKICRTISDTVAPLAIAVPAYYITDAIIKKDSASRARAVITTGSVVITTVVVNVLKFTVQRDRPFVTYPLDVEQKADVGPYSFPSGHTGTAFSVATSISIIYPKWYVIAPSFLWAS